MRVRITTPPTTIKGLLLTYHDTLGRPLLSHVHQQHNSNDDHSNTDKCRHNHKSISGHSIMNPLIFLQSHVSSFYYSFASAFADRPLFPRRVDPGWGRDLKKRWNRRCRVCKEGPSPSPAAADIYLNAHRSTAVLRSTVPHSQLERDLLQDPYSILIEDNNRMILNRVGELWDRNAGEDCRYVLPHAAHSKSLRTALDDDRFGARRNRSNILVTKWLHQRQESQSRHS